MADNSPLKIYAVPRCVAAPAGQAELRGQLIEIDRMADGGQSDGFITAENFDSLKNKFPDLKRFQSFGDFKGYIEQYTASQRCTPACKEESKLQNQLPHPELGEPICIAPPAPELPPMPETPKGPPDISGFKTDYPGWFDDVSPRAKAREDEVPPRQIPTLEGAIAAQWPLDFLGPEDVGDDIDTSQKKFLRINPDGSVILEKAVNIYPDGREIKKLSTGEAIAEFVGKFVPQMGVIIMFVANPQRAWSEYLNRVKRREEVAPLAPPPSSPKSQLFYRPPEQVCSGGGD